MSHITRIVKTQIRDLEALVKALHDLNLGKVEVHDGPKSVRIGAEWRAAEVIVRRGLRIWPNDFGFRHTQDGTFALLCRSTIAKSILEQVMQRYVYHLAREKLEAQGFTLVTDEVQDGNRIHMVLRRTV